jgi:hypothetical protein
MAQRIAGRGFIVFVGMLRKSDKPREAWNAMLRFPHVGKWYSSNIASHLTDAIGA